jgi:hypothetical protein
MVMQLAGKHMQTIDGLPLHTSLQPKFSMEPGYTPEHFPNQQKMQQLALETKDASLQRALLDFQYPFRTEDLMRTNYSNAIKQVVLQAVSS